MPTLSDNVIQDSNSGNLVINGTLNCKNFTQIGTPGTTTRNDGISFNVYGDLTLLPGKFIDGGTTGQIQIRPDATSTITTGGNAIGAIQFNRLGGTLVLGDNLSGFAGKMSRMSINGTLNLNGKTISGNSAVNRLLIYSDTIGTPRTITVAGGSFVNCDFQDIAFANGGADLDFSAGSIGNCGGNSMSGGGTLTFPPVRTCTFASTGGNWSDAAKWTDDLGGHAVPLVHHLARFQPMSAGQTITVDMPRLPDTDFSGCGSSNLPSVAATTTGLTYSIYGSLNLTGVATGGWSCNKVFTFAVRSNASLTSNGQTWAATELQLLMPACILTANDALTMSTNSTLKPLYGTFTSVYSVTCANVSGNSGAGLTLGAGTLTLTLGGSVFNMGSGVNVSCVSTPISITYTGANACSFSGGVGIFGDITIAPGSGVLTFSGAFTFRNMTMSSAGTRSIVFTKDTTYTMTGDSFLNGAGVDDAPIITPSLLNGGFETAGAGGADVFANWGEVYAGTSTINRDTSDKYAGDASCRFDMDASASIVRVTQSVMTIGRLYKLEFYAKTSFVGTGTNLAWVGATTLGTVQLTANYAKYTFFFTADGTTLALRNNGSASSSIWIDEITLTPINSVAIQSDTHGATFTLTKASGLIASNYLAIKDSIATGGAVWLAGYNSTNISGNTGWHFNSPASGAGVIEFVGSATAKALCRGIPAAAEIVFTVTATAKALCRAAGSGVIEFVGSCSAIVAAWKTTGLFKATERYIGQYFKASKRR